MAVVLAEHPKWSLELLKYQTLISDAFAKSPAEACLEYDRCFRLQASKNSKLTWNKYKEDIFIWCFAPKPASAGLGTHANAWEAQTFRPKANAWDTHAALSEQNGNRCPARTPSRHSHPHPQGRRDLHPLQHKAWVLSKQGWQQVQIRALLQSKGLWRQTLCL